MMKLYDKMFFMSPTPLGDAFMLSGMVHYYGDRCNELHVPVMDGYYETLSTLYQDYPNIKVMTDTSYNYDDEGYIKKYNLGRIMRIEYLPC